MRRFSSCFLPFWEFVASGVVHWCWSQLEDLSNIVGFFIVLGEKSADAESLCAIIFHCLRLVSKNVVERVVAWHNPWRLCVRLSEHFACIHPLLHTVTVCFLISLPFPVSCYLNP